MSEKLLANLWDLICENRIEIEQYYKNLDAKAVADFRIKYSARPDKMDVRPRKYANMTWGKLYDTVFNDKDFYFTCTSKTHEGMFGLIIPSNEKSYLTFSTEEISSYMLKLKVGDTPPKATSYGVCNYRVMEFKNLRSIVHQKLYVVKVAMRRDIKKGDTRESQPIKECTNRLEFTNDEIALIRTIFQ